MGEWESMTIDELFALREQMVAVLSARLVAKKAALESRLQQLNRSDAKIGKSRRRAVSQRLAMIFGPAYAWKLLPLVSSL
jgi:hypothetical protein